MKTRLRGITILEVMVAIAIFSLISSAAIKSFLVSNALSVRAADKTKALWLAEEGIEATRSIRDKEFGALIAGTHGMTGAAGTWQFSGTSDYTDGYQRSVILTSGGSDSIMATSSVSWNTNGSTSTVALGTHLTNWHKISGTQASHTTIGTGNASISQANTSLLTGITLSTDGSYASTTITSIKVTWTPTTPATRRLSEILSPNGTVVYGPGAILSGVSVVVKPIILVGAATSSVQFLWNADISGKSFTLVFTFTDGSTQTVTSTNPQTQ
jgi:prepilin-type N-terminal cleavage/methylation domain-containing protein